MLDFVQLAPLSAVKRNSRFAAIHWNVVSGLVVLAIGGLATLGLSTFRGLSSGEPAKIIKTQEVVRGNMLVTVTEEGNVEKRQQR